MRTIEKKYEEIKKEYAAETWNEYDLPGGKVAVNPNGLEALVMTDGRYPTYDEGYQINDYISETEKILWGAAVIELPDTLEIIVTKEGESYTFLPKVRFSITGKCVCHVSMDQVWDSSQKHYVD